MPVVSASGVVGKVAEVGKDKAKVLLVTDPSFSVAALAQRSREIGLVSGTLQGLCRMRYLPAGADLQVGDLVITSQFSSSFPEGLLIGEIVTVKYRPHDEMLETTIQPSVPLSQVEEVLIILKNAK
jgi:rod shape-determining protein MreC